ncbi:nucleotidyltransferase domain-containing protein [Pleurocapsales cyanobacterium LEGE 06147]|nr:nucleotidyltransferase domain-containing protein [Pleurocapsales cyanobacterium LEGE 06147]
MSFLGSVLREDFRPNNNINIMVSFEEDAPWRLLELVGIKPELKTLLEREVDLLTKKSIEQSYKWIRQKEILGTAQVVYVAG